jgi:NADPH-dependent glutamate synthase beta subunit-like oxidoreductase
MALQGAASPAAFPERRYADHTKRATRRATRTVAAIGAGVAVAAAGHVLARVRPRHQR